MFAPEAEFDPFSVLRMAVGGIFLFVIAAAVVLAVTGIFPKALILVGTFWTLYGIVRFTTDRVAEPGAALVADLIGNGGSARPAAGHSEIETLAAQGKYRDAAERWYQVAATDEAPAAAMLRRAELLAGPLGDPGTAAAELTLFRDAPRRPLRPAEDLAIGLALGNIYEHRLHDAPRAMFELRRLLDKYPASRHVRLIRAALRDLKARRFGDAYAPTPTS
ncbi:MAG TPA: hypothetical protein VFI13_00995 [Gemmatimonadales bacterium]|nr:hypothetical protein [Gemmatimonadales bacterium]